MLIHAVHAVVAAESIPANRRRAFKAFGFSEKEIQTRIEWFGEVAKFLRSVARKHFCWLLLDLPGPLVTELPDKLETLAERLADRLPPSVLRQLREAPIAALKHYVKVCTDRPHYDEIADLIAAARYASGRKDEVDVDVIRKRGAGFLVEDRKAQLKAYEKELSMARVQPKTVGSKR